MRVLTVSLASMATACRTIAALLGLAAISTHAQFCAVPGKEGPVTISGTVNTYYAGVDPVLNAQATSLTLGAINPGGSTTAPQVGDILLIIQMQGATIDARNDDRYGDGGGTGLTSTTRAGNVARGYTGTPSAGQHEYVRVTSVVGSTVTFQGASTPSNGLLNTYTQAAASAAQGRQTYQIVRVPQYASATLNSGTPVTAPPWNGATGGIIAFDVTGTLTTNAGTGNHVDVSNRGFRGGFGNRGPVENLQTFYASNANALGQARDTTKGEGIAGTPRHVFDGAAGVVIGTTQGYPGGDAGRGAPGNAGGAGVGHNTGGGGGGNGGAGGLGGAEYNTQNDYGAYGGAAFPQTGAVNPDRLVMGGGGGAGDSNGGGTEPVPDIEGAGGVGGGIVLINAGNVGARLNISANGQAGNTNSCEAGGGGGAGGTVKLIAGAGLGNVNVNAVGGAGGSQQCTVHSAGGGGGGGTVITNGSIASTVITGGAGGVAPSAGNWSGVAGSPGAGINTAGTDLPGVDPGYTCLPNLTVTKSTSTPTIDVSGATTATYNITVANSGAGAAIGASLVDNTLPPGWTWGSTSSIAFTPALSASALGGFVESATAGTPAVANSPGTVANLTTNGAPSTAPVWGRMTIPASGSVTLSYVVNIPASASVGTYHNPAGVNYLDPTRTTATRVIAPLAQNTSNRAGAQVGGTADTTYQSGANTGGTVAGSNYNGLAAGPAGEDVTLRADLSITKANSSATPTLASNFSYTLTPRNNGRAIQDRSYPSDQATTASAATLGPVLTNLVTDTLPTGVVLTGAPTGTNWSCTGTAGASAFACTYSGAYPWAAATNLPTITVPVTTTSAACGAVRINTATMGTAAIGEGNITNNSGSDTGITPNCQAGVSIAKTDTRTTSATNVATTYSITVTNSGPAPANGTLVTDPVATGLSCTGVSCTASGGAVCPGTPTLAALQGTGLSVPVLPAGGSVVLTVTCNVTATGS
jgi:uncharacterized repeat protein (TIGR01451 family)